MELFSPWEIPPPVEPLPRRKWLPALIINLTMTCFAGHSLYRDLHHPVYAQTIDTGATSAKPRGHVSFAAEAQSVAANQPAVLQLHFRVDPGFHINSHTPKSEMLIPTKIAIDDLSGAEVSAVDFPKGTEFSFAFEPKQKLDVYTGDVLLTAHLKAKPGSYTLKGALRYQACDNAACYPPRLLAVEQPFTAK